MRFGGFGLDENGINSLLLFGRRTSNDNAQHRNDDVTYDDLQLKGSQTVLQRVALKARYSRPSKQPSQCELYP